MIFDKFISWIAHHSMLSLLPSLLIGLSIALGVFSLTKLVVRTRPKESQEWRDPPPLIYKLFKPIVGLFSHDVHLLMSKTYYARLSNRLSAGGMNYAVMPHEFVTLKLVSMVVAFVVSVSLYNIDSDLGPEALVFLFMVVPVGFFYPDIWLGDKIGSRRRMVAKEFPFLVELLVLSMKAGLNYSTSLSQAVVSLPHGPVKEEFNKLLREVRAGKPRRDALLDLGKRMNIHLVDNFVASLNQAEETGGEIVDVLMAQADQKRSERFSYAEEMANKAPIKMLIPMMIFLFPIIFMLLTFVMIVKLSEIDMIPESMLRLLYS